MKVQVYPVHTEVYLFDDILGEIKQVCIGNNNNISYQITWWDARNYKSDWFNENQFKTCFAKDKKVDIGFKSCV